MCNYKRFHQKESCDVQCCLRDKVMSSLQIQISIFAPKIVTFLLLEMHSGEKFCFSVLYMSLINFLLQIFTPFSDV